MTATLKDMVNMPIRDPETEKLRVAELEQRLRRVTETPQDKAFRQKLLDKYHFPK